MRKLNNKLILTAFIVFFSFFYSIPVIFQNSKLLPDLLREKTIRLGLDLQGGSQLLLQIETEEALKEKLQNLLEDIRNKFQENEVAVVIFH